MSPSPARPCLLLVEDNPGDVELLRLAFEDSGRDVEIASAPDGRTALRMLQAAAKEVVMPYRLIALDINLPLMNGLELLAHIKRDPKLSSVPTVMLTSSNSQVDRNASESLQADAYLIKPSSFGDYAAITAVLARYLYP